MNIKQIVTAGVAGVALAASSGASAKTCTTSLQTVAYTVTNLCGAGWYYFVPNTSVEVDLVWSGQGSHQYYGARIRGTYSDGDPVPNCEAYDGNPGVNGWVGDFADCGDAVKWRGYTYFNIIW